MKTLTEEQFIELRKNLREIADRTKRGSPYNRACESLDILQRVGDADIAIQRKPMSEVIAAAAAVATVSEERAKQCAREAGAAALEFLRDTAKSNEALRKAALTADGQAQAYETIAPYMRDVVGKLVAIGGSEGKAKA